jgi:hypothetical protein
MRRVLLITTCVALVGFAGAAMAQSGQGGYLGLNPGGHLGTPGTPPQMGSLQGGYLGKNPGGALQQTTPATAPGPTSAPTAWCDGFSMVPGRCRNRAAADHDWCATRQPTRYADCRRTMDFMGWPP